MSLFLELTRDLAVKANVDSATECWESVTESIRQDAEKGLAGGRYSVSEWPKIQREAVVTALKLQGFYASFQNESYSFIDVNWMPRVK